MRKTILALMSLMLCGPAWTATEYLRPSADANTTATSTCDASGNHDTSSSMSAVYSGKSGAGPIGSSASISDTGTTVTRYEARVFSIWQSSSQTYTALTLNLSVGCTTTDSEGAGGACGAAYSTNSGSTWTNAYSFISEGGSDSKHTVTVTITGATLSNVEVETCARGYSDGDSGDSATLTVYDIWTAGTYGNTTHTRTWLLSYLDEQIWRWHDAKPEDFYQFNSQS